VVFVMFDEETEELAARAGLRVAHPPAELRHGIVSESEAFYLCITGPGDHRYRGADLGALVTRGRLQADDNQLEERCKQWITGVRAQFAGMQPAAQQAPASLLNFKMA
jgi:hypothetical protein